MKHHLPVAVGPPVEVAPLFGLVRLDPVPVLDPVSLAVVSTDLLPVGVDSAELGKDMPAGL